VKVMMPPMATARTTAAEVQLAGVPWPMTWFGRAVLTARPARGTCTRPFRLPYLGSWLAEAGGVAASACDGVDVTACGAATGVDNVVRVALAGSAALAG